MMQKKKHEKLLSICITSYNRVDELVRCIKSIKTRYNKEIEIIISEDHSEQCEIIRSTVMDLQKAVTTEIFFNSNELNLGFDKNLRKLITLSNSKYILFLSDDDSLIENSLDSFIELLQKNEYNMIFSPFILECERKRYYSHSFTIGKGIENTTRYLYDSILFSGLLFRREHILKISAERFLNCNYFQVYLFMYMMLMYDTDYINIPLVLCNGDGENAFGKAISSNGNNLLADRKSIYSNIEFHKGLIKVIKIFEMDFSIDVITLFGREYCLRAFTGMSLARAQGFSTYRVYWKCLKSLNISLTKTIYIYHIMLILLGSRLSNSIVFIPRSILMRHRTDNSNYINTL
ncbi:MAG: glycosyltransferase family 2 protein [Mobilitalea sp.]